MSDWSSDVCSSDLVQRATGFRELQGCGSARNIAAIHAGPLVRVCCHRWPPVGHFLPGTTAASGSSGQRGLPGTPASCARIHLQREINPGGCNSKENNGSRALVPGAGTLRARSEEHTSELQSLMRISYAVF